MILYKHIFIYSMLGILAATAQGQQTNQIAFDASGKIIPAVPDKINKDDKLVFRMKQPDETFDSYEKVLKDRITKAKQRLVKLKSSPENLQLLKDIFDIDPPEIDAVTADIDKVAIGASLTYVPVFKTADKSYFHITLKHTEDAFDKFIEPNKASDEATAALEVDAVQLGITIGKNLPFEKLAYTWLYNTRGDYAAPISFSKYLSDREQLKTQNEKVTEFLKNYETKLAGSNGVFKPADVPFLQTATKEAITLTGQLNALIATVKADIQLHNYKPWMLKWMWYQNKEIPDINPFTFKATDDLPQEPDTAQLPGIREKIDSRVKLIGNANLKKLTIKQLDAIIAETDDLRKTLNEKLAAYKRYSEATASNEKNLQAFATTSKQLNNGQLFVGDPDDRIYYMRNHDASNNYQLMTESGADEYLEGDRVVILAHNLLENEKTSIHLEFAEISNDQSEIAEQGLALIGQLTGIQSALKPVPTIGLIKPEDDAKKKAKGAIDDLKDAMKTIRQLIMDVDYLIKQSNPVTTVEEKSDKANAYHSQLVNPSKKIDGPKKATYYLGTTTTATAAAATNAADTDKPIADTFTYRINKLYRLFPMAGIAYTTVQLNDISIDSASHQGKNTMQAQVHVIIGLKVYVRKTDIRDGKIFTGTDIHGRPLWPSRTSFTVAFDAKKPLNNVYLGGALDIFPGLTFNIGCVINKYTYNSYSNLQLVQSKTMYRPGFYLGLTTDVSLLAGIAKLLNL